MRCEMLLMTSAGKNRCHVLYSRCREGRFEGRAFQALINTCSQNCKQFSLSCLKKKA